MTVPEEFSIVDFSGGLYAVATDIDGQDNQGALNAIKQFIAEKGCYKEDSSRAYLGNVITPPSASKAMGYRQMDHYVPVLVMDEVEEKK